MAVIFNFCLCSCCISQLVFQLRLLVAVSVNVEMPCVLLRQLCRKACHYVTVPRLVVQSSTITSGMGVLLVRVVGCMGGHLWDAKDRCLHVAWTGTNGR